jgi:hypothetical protein
MNRTLLIGLFFATSLVAAEPLRLGAPEALHSAVSAWAKACAAAHPGWHYTLADSSGAPSAASLAALLEGKLDVVSPPGRFAWENSRPTRQGLEVLR